ncbi:MAG TPA: VTT domain-containing protein [Clostridia bacterium]|nr:VTT domain-containing protein [Clostridia bacterium]
MTDFIKSLKSKENLASKIIVITGVLAVIITFAVIYTIYGKELWELVSDPVEFREWLSKYKNKGEIIFVAIRAFQTVIKIIPAEPLEIGAGYIFGTWWGFLWCMLGTGIGSIVIVILTKLFGYKIVQVFISKEKIESLTFLKNTKKLGVTLFIIYLIPGTPKDIITYLIGFTPMKMWVFFLITGIARIPAIITSTMCGAALGVKNWTAAIIIYAVTLVFSIIGFIVYKRMKGNLSEQNEIEDKVD